MALSDDHRAKIRVEQLSFYYGAVRVLEDNQLDIAEGQVTALIGPTGSGKSTHLRTYNWMYSLYAGQRAEGRVMLDDINVLEPGAIDGNELRARVGMVLQTPAPFPMSVWDNVAFGLRLAGASREVMERAVVQSLQRVGVWDELRSRFDESAMGLSVGQQQLVCIARVLAVEPEVLLFDEPCSALDPGASARVEDLVRSLRGSVTVVIATNNVQQAARVSDYTALLVEGKVVEHASTDEIFTRPTEQRTEDYITGKFG
jgi:phosphate transport system ATP-binding protein